MADVKVIIIGAGSAGIGAAHRLLLNGFKPDQVTVLEASDRLGGRVHTAQFGIPSNSLIELGANWIHGATVTNPLYTFASEYGLLKNLEYMGRRESVYYKSNGVRIDKEVAKKTYDIIMEIDTEASQVNNLPSGDKTTLHDFMTKRFNERLSEFPKNHREDMEAIFNSLQNYFNFHIGDVLEKVSLREYHLYHELPGGVVKLPSGFSVILESVVNDLPLLKIQYERKVSNIDYSNQDEVLVHTEKGHIFSADHVIVTVPLGHLKKYHETLFTPSLPKVNLDAIKNLGFGRVNKVFLLYKRAFWSTDFKPLCLAWRNDEKSREFHSEEDWVKGILGFDPVLNNPNLLVAWIAGPAAEFMERLSKSRIAMDCTRIIRKFTNNPLIPLPWQVQRSTWCNNDLSLGAYTYFPVNCPSDAVKDLSEPVPKSKEPRVLFAGEATHPNHFSTVHGALLSGVREADRLLQLYPGGRKQRRN